MRFDLDEAAIKPYFPLERMVAAAFDCAARLFGISFVARPDIVVYHPDVARLRGARRGRADRPVPARQLRAADQAQRRLDERLPDAVEERARRRRPVLPIIVNNNNFAKGAPGAPTLLSFDDARTLFHEFGHGLHGLLSNVTYERVSGTNVLRDFVELPSQLFEHWLEEPAVLKRHARHYQTGAPIPDALIERAASRAPLQPGLRDGALRRFGAGRPSSAPSIAPATVPE